MRIGIDTWIDLIPEAYFGDGPKAQEGFSLCTSFDEDGIPNTHIHVGPYGERVSKTIPKIVKLLVDEGHNLIVDEVLLGENHYQDILKDYTVYYIGVTCELSVLESREKKRGDRCLGMARAQSHIVHKAIQRYDEMVDTTYESSDDIARRILKKYIEPTP